MGFTFDFHGTDAKLNLTLQGKSDELMLLLAEKMMYDMNLLAEKAKSAAPIGPPPFSENDDHVPGTLRDSIQDPTVEYDGGVITGSLKWGGDLTTVSYKEGRAYDYARILNEGSKSHAVNPIEEEGSRFPAEKTLSGTSKRRFGKGTLFFMGFGGTKESFAEYAFPRGVTPNKFVEDALMEMKGQFISDLQQTLFGLRD